MRLIRLSARLLSWRSISVRATKRETELLASWASQRSLPKRPVPLLQSADSESLSRSRSLGLLRSALGEGNLPLALDLYRSLASGPGQRLSVRESSDFLNLCQAKFFVGTQSHAHRPALDGAQTVLKDMLSRREHYAIDLSPGFFAKMLSGYAYLSDLAAVNSVWSLIGECGKQPRSEDYDTILKIYALEGSLKPLKTVMASLLSRSDISLTTSMYTSMITAHANGGKYGQASQLLEDMIAKGITPDIRVLNALLGAHGKAGNVAGMEAVIKILAQFSLPYSRTTYNNLIHGFSQAKNLDRALNTFKTMETDSLSSPERFNLCSPDAATYNILINMYSKANDPETAVLWAQKMIQNKFEPDVYSYTSIMDGFRRTNSLQECLSTFKLMASRRGGVKHPGPYSVLMNFYASKGDLAEMMNVYNAMLSARVQPDRFVYEFLIRVYATRFEMDSAMDWYRKLKAAGMTISRAGATWLLKAWAQVGKGEEEIKEIRRDVVKAGLTVPDFGSPPHSSSGEQKAPCAVTQ